MVQQQPSISEILKNDLAVKESLTAPYRGPIFDRKRLSNCSIAALICGVNVS
jgi:hypothetical protein